MESSPPIPNAVTHGMITMRLSSRLAEATWRFVPKKTRTFRRSSSLCFLAIGSEVGNGAGGGNDSTLGGEACGSERALRGADSTVAGASSGISLRGGCTSLDLLTGTVDFRRTDLLAMLGLVAGAGATVRSGRPIPCRTVGGLTSLLMLGALVPGAVSLGLLATDFLTGGGNSSATGLGGGRGVGFVATSLADCSGAFSADFFAAGDLKLLCRSLRLLRLTGPE